MRQPNYKTNTKKESYISGQMLYAVSSAYFFNIQHCFSYLQRYKTPCFSYLQRYKTAKKIHFRWSSRPNGLASRWRLPRRHGITGWSVSLFEDRRQAFKRKNLPRNSLWENVLHNKIKRLIKKGAFFARSPHVLYFLQY